LRSGAPHALGRIIALQRGVASGQFVRQHQQLEPLHRRLAEFNRLRFTPSLESGEWQSGLRQEVELRLAEGHFLESERARAAQLAEAVPTQPEEFVDWFDGLRATGARGSHDFYRWLAESATRSELSWVLSQELAGEDIPEDLFALTQLRLPWRPKLEMARCYWDEMGQGHASAMRARILDGLEREIHVELTQPPLWECLARSNLMIGLASNRSYAFQAIGALGALELTTAGPARALAAGLKRLGFAIESSAYFASRGKVGVLRSHAWNQEVILPLVARDARVATAVAEGAFMRLAADARCIERYSAELRQRAKHPAA
jgi:hypothetical protein